MDKFTIVAVALIVSCPFFLIGYFCKRTAKKKQIYDIVYIPSFFVIIAMYIIMLAEAYLLSFKMNVVEWNGVLFYVVTLFPLAMFLGFSGKEPILAFKGVPLKTVPTTFKKKMFGVFAGIVALFGTAFLVSMIVVDRLA